MVVHRVMEEAMLKVKRLPTDYRWATNYESDYPDGVIDPILVPIMNHGIVSYFMAVPTVLPMPCVREFGEHECGGDECASEQTLYNMHAYDDYPIEMDYPSYDPQYDHYEQFGRPAFPNEY